MTGGRRALDGFRALDEEQTTQTPPEEGGGVWSVAPRPIAETGGVIAGRYVLAQALARGTLGQVWRATDRETAADVALKLVPRLGPETWERFRREAEIAATLAGPHFAVPYAFGETDDLAYFAMELLIGEDLAKRLDRAERLEKRVCVELIDALAAGLTVAHQAGVVHRDLKPKNVFVVRSEAGDRFKIIDFGVAKHAAVAARVTKSGVLLGTPHYMSPEQVVDVRAVDARTDLWSLGAIAYRALLGRRPFEGGLSELLFQITRLDAPKPSSLMPWLGSSVDHFFERALAKAPAERFEDAPSLARAFRRAVEAS